jgi:hypothetical protein
MKVVKKKDMFDRGVISFIDFNNILIDYGVRNTLLEPDFDEIWEFLTFCMKKRRFANFCQEKKDFFFSEKTDKENEKYSLFDLFYESLNDFIDEYNSNGIKNPYALIREYMEGCDIINAEKIFEPVLKSKNILKINNREYVDIIILNKFLRSLGIIRENDKIVVNTFEEELVDIREFIDEIYNEKNVEEKNENYEEIKHKADHLVDEILQLNF